MIRLIGITESVYQETIGGPFETHEEREVVALFDDLESAQAYVKSARLKKEIRESFSGTVRYRRGSVLEGCADYELVDDSLSIVPVNPVF